MNHLKLLYICLVLALCLVSCSLYSESKEAGADDQQVLVNQLLGIEDPRFGSGEDHDYLQSYKAWERFYLRVLEAAESENQGQSSSLRKFLLIGYIADIKSDAAMSEMFTGDAKPLYEKRQQDFLTSLQENSFLIPSTCSRIGAFFGFEGKNVDGKKEFMLVFAHQLEEVLTEDAANECLWFFIRSST